MADDLDRSGRFGSVEARTVSGLAQATTGTIAGAVTRASDGAAVSGATVRALQAGVIKGSASSGADGTFSMGGLAAGTYEVQVSAAGYETQTRTAVTVSEQATTTADFSLGATGITYVYDTLGRLIAVIDPSGEVTRYEYDAVGNVQSVSRQASAPVSVIDFTPKRGLTGTVVTIYGTGFSAAPGQNIVSFNGAAATVTSATATQIVTTVPAGATTGPINVTTPAGSASSGVPFTVASSGPVIDGFTPAVAAAGAAVNIAGSNFEPAPSGNRVTLNGRRTTAVAATAASITTTVPAGGTSGRFSVGTAEGRATSGDYLFVPPPPFAAADVEVTGQTAVGESKSLTITTANMIGLIVFEGTAGQRVSLRVSASTVASAVVNIYNPDGSSLGSVTANTSGGFIDARTLPADGTYTILVDPATTNTGGLTLNLFNTADASAAITPGGPAVTVTTTVPGQNAKLTFGGTAGQRISLKVDNSTYGGGNSRVYIYNPDGTLLASDTSVYTGDFIDTRTLAATGTYSIVIDPESTFTGSMTLSLYDVPADASAAITPGGPAASVTTTVPGQNAKFTYTGTAGQRVSLRFDATTYGGGNSRVYVYNPDGTLLASDTSVYAGDFIDAHTLPADGTYTIVVDPEIYHVGSLTVTLYEVPTDVTGTITPGGPAATVTTTVAGQNAKLTFDGTAGQRVSLRIENSTYGGGNSRVYIYNPDGTLLASDTSVYTGDFIDVKTLPATGTYTILIDPELNYVGSMTLRLYDVPPDTSATIVPGGPAVTVTTTVPGQNAKLTFEATAGQRISLKVDNSTYGGGNSRVYVYNPDGTLLTSDTSVYTGDFFDARTLAAAGTYTIVVDPEGAFTGSMTFSLYDVSDTSGTITAGGPAVTVALPVPGQNGRLTFTGTTGQRVSLRMTGVTIASSAVSVARPDGTALVAATTVNTSGNFFDTRALPADGTYTILIDPASSNTGNMTLTLYDVPADINGTITPGGPAVTVTPSVPGQNALLSFEGSAGQRVSLRMTGVTVPGTTAVVIRKPDGTNLVSGSTTTSGSYIDAQTLPSTGTYSILVDPASFNTGGVTLTLNDANEINGTIAPGGPAVTVSVTVPGQNARLTFTGTTGQRVSLRMTGVTIASSAVSIARPDGAALVAATTVNTSGNFFDTRALPADGTYTILIDPASTNTGNMTLTLYDVPADGNAPITPGGAAVTLTLGVPGQNALLSFDGAAGQQVSLRMTGVTIAGTTALTIRKPDGTSLATGTTTTSGGYIDTKALPSAGTYTIFVDPASFNTGAITLTLNDVLDVTGTITPGGPAVTTSVTTAGQVARLTFNGTAGQRVSLRMTGVTIASSAVSVARPDGTALVAATTVNTSGNFFDTRALPADGTYTILIDPASTNTGNMTLTLYDVPADVSGGASVGGPAVAVTTAVPGQNALLTFEGTAGQQVTVRVTGNTMGSTAVKLLRPDGTQQASSTSSSSGFNLATQTLPATGTYTVSIDPAAANVGTMNVTLTNP